MAVVDSHNDNAQQTARRWARAEAERAFLIRLAQRRGLSPEDAEDCVQEAILRVVLHPALDEARMGALLNIVVRRSAVDFHRRSVTASRAVERIAGLSSFIDTADPELAALEGDEARQAARVIDRLPTAQRLALLARADGRPVNDIAAEMATSPKAVESLIARARAAARNALAAGLTAVVKGMRRLRRPHPPTAVTAAAAVTLAALALALPVWDTFGGGGVSTGRVVMPGPTGPRPAPVPRPSPAANPAVDAPLAPTGPGPSDAPATLVEPHRSDTGGDAAAPTPPATSPPAIVDPGDPGGKGEDDPGPQNCSDVPSTMSGGMGAQPTRAAPPSPTPCLQAQSLHIGPPTPVLPV